MQNENLPFVLVCLALIWFGGVGGMAVVLILLLVRAYDNRRAQLGTSKYAKLYYKYEQMYNHISDFRERFMLSREHLLHDLDITNPKHEPIIQEVNYDLAMGQKLYFDDFGHTRRYHYERTSSIN